MMWLSKLLQGGSKPPALVGMTCVIPSTGANAIPWPAGTAAGDFAIFGCFNNGANFAPSTGGWTTITSSVNNGLNILGKVLTTADLTATVAPTGAPNLIAIVIRGASSASVGGVFSATGGSTTTGPISAFTKNAGAKALVHIGWMNDSANSRSYNTGLANAVLSALPGAGSNPTFPFQARLTMKPSDYNNTDTWTITHTSATFREACVLQIL